MPNCPLTKAVDTEPTVYEYPIATAMAHWTLDVCCTISKYCLVTSVWMFVYSW